MLQQTGRQQASTRWQVKTQASQSCGKCVAGLPQMLELDTTASNLFGVGGDFKMIAHAKKPYSEINVCCPGGNRSIQTERLSLLPFQTGLKFYFRRAQCFTLEE